MTRQTAKLKGWFRQKIVAALLFEAGRDPAVGGKLAAAVLKSFAGQKNLDALAPTLAQIIPAYLDERVIGKYFQLWEDSGFHITQNHYYSPIPDTRRFTPELFERQSEMVGVDFNLPEQKRLLEEVFPCYQDEYNRFPRQPEGPGARFYFDNGLFSGLDALVYYCMVRHYRPGLVLEVGSGFSTLISAQAALRNGGTQVKCIEPYPQDFLKQGFAGLSGLIEKPVQELGLAPFQDLNSGDILFIDTSHVTRIGGEVNFLFLEVLPRLRPGVIVHIHDIFLPREYPQEWFAGCRMFSNEQYLVQAFLAFNSAFEVLFAIAWMASQYPQAIKKTFPNSPFWSGDSLWIRRKA